MSNDEILFETSKWLQSKGLKKTSAQKYITSLFFALSHQAISNSNKDLGKLVKNSQTPRGLNEQTLKFLKKQNFYKKLKYSLNEILKRLK